VNEELKMLRALASRAATAWLELSVCCGKIGVVRTIERKTAAYGLAKRMGSLLRTSKLNLASEYYSTAWKKTVGWESGRLYFDTDPEVKMIFNVYAEFIKKNGTSDSTAVEKLGIGGEVARPKTRF